MSSQVSTVPIVRRAGEGEQCWFHGGGTWTWKASGAETGGDLLVVEVEMDGGKMTPLHTHPVAESMWVLEGRLRYRIEEEDHEIGSGDFVLVPGGVAHAFLVLGDGARVLAIQPSGECEAFYRGASEPLEGSARVTDFEAIGHSAEVNGGITILGPPPF